ncbi:MAG: O-antigen ligase family protein [Burkholderiaceae bacterium]|nr:O-antigen ligase family protein [Burkholderiaceae bacterium]
MKIILIAVFLLLAAVLGILAALFGGESAIILTIVVGVFLGLCIDPRVGVVALVLLAPLTSIQIVLKLFIIVAGMTAVLMVGKSMFAETKFAMPPRYFIIGYVGLMLMATIIGFPHIGAAHRILSEIEGAANFTPYGYFRYVYLGKFSLVLYAVLLANALRQSKVPSRFLLAYALSVALPVAAIFAVIAIWKIPLSSLQSSRGFLAVLGGHANEFGMLLATACGPLLFLASDMKGKAIRWIAGAALLIAVTGLLLTFSRGGYAAFVAIVAYFLVTKRRFRALAMVGGLAVILFAFAPTAVHERVMTGMVGGSNQVGASGQQLDSLTAGRLGVYEMLLPEIQRSPIVGRGIGSTVWTEPFLRGQYKAQHPHNLYLEILLDVGIFGLVVMGYLYYRYLRGLKSISNDESISPEISCFAAGAKASIFGMLVMGFTNGHWLPHFEQSYFWFFVAVVFAFAVEERKRVGGASSIRSFGIRPLASK